MISSPFLPNAPRDICYSTVYGEVFFLARSPELFGVLYPIFPRTSRALFLFHGRKCQISPGAKKAPKHWWVSVR